MSWWIFGRDGEQDNGEQTGYGDLSQHELDDDTAPDLMAEAYEAEAAEMDDGTLLTSLDPAAYQYVSTDYLVGDVSNADVLAGYLGTR